MGGRVRGYVGRGDKYDLDTMLARQHSTFLSREEEILVMNFVYQIFLISSHTSYTSISNN